MNIFLLVLGIILIIGLCIIWGSALGEEAEHYYDSEWILKQMCCGNIKTKEKTND